MAVLLTPPKLQFFDNNGDPLAFGKVYTYAATGGTFATPKATYTTQAGDVVNANPIILDAAGRANIWIEGSYDFNITDANDVQLYTQLAVTAFTALPAESDSYSETLSGNGTQTAFTVSEDLGTDENAIYVWVDNTNREYVTNGSFATDTGWTKGSGWTIGSGVATATGGISTAIEQTAAFTVEQYRAYTVTFTITRSAGTLTPSIGGTSGTAQNASGTYTETILAGSTQTIAFTGAGFTGTLDNVSIVVTNSAGFQVQPPANYTINGTTLTLTSAPASDTNNIFVSAPSLLVGAASSAAADAATSAAAALASEQQAGAYAGQLTITSTTSLAIGTGSKVFTVAADLALSAGQFILIVSDADAANYMWGTIASYSGTTLTITVAATGGSGTLNDWTMYLTGERGAVGATGSVSDLSGVPSGTPADADTFIFTDVDDSNTTKKVAFSGIQGGLVLLSTQTASASASVDFESLITSTYKNYLLVLSSVRPATDGARVFIRTSTDNGSTYASSGYSNHVSFIEHGSTTYTAIASDTTGIGLTNEVGNATTEAYSGTVIIHDPLNTATATCFSMHGCSINSSGTPLTNVGTGSHNTAADVDAVQVLFSSGNITSGVIKLFGIL